MSQLLLRAAAMRADNGPYRLGGVSPRNYTGLAANPQCDRSGMWRDRVEEFAGAVTLLQGRLEQCGIKSRDTFDELVSFKKAPALLTAITANHVPTATALLAAGVDPFI